MKKVFYNDDNLKKEEIDETVTRVKGLIINDKDEIILVYSNKSYQFPGGHLEKGEEILDCLYREVREETGIVFDTEETKLIKKATYYTKNYRNTNKNRENIIYYYLIRSNKKINLNNIDLDEWEKTDEFKVNFISLNKVKDLLMGDLKNADINRLIYKEILDILEELKKGEL